MSEPVLEALNLLRDTYPEERTGIIARWYPLEKRFLYTAEVGEELTVYVHQLPSPVEAANRAIAQAGDRSRLAMLNKRIAKLQAELAELQAQQTKAA